jgi:hypothetical protein
VPDKLQMERAGSDAPRPMVLAIAGDSAAGKTTLTEGLVKAVGRRLDHFPVCGTTNATTGKNHRDCRSPRCTRAPTTCRSWSSILLQRHCDRSIHPAQHLLGQEIR